MTTATLTDSTSPRTSLDDLAKMTFAQLDTLYRHGQAGNLKNLDGQPASRMLTLRFLDNTPLFPAVSWLARQAFFPWAGKAFKASGNTSGEGINRIRALSERQWFPFNTRLDSSWIDGKPCVLLDYDLPENPWFIRKIRDELKEVAPGLYLGPAMWKTSATAGTTLLWFAVDGRQA